MIFNSCLGKGLPILGLLNQSGEYMEFIYKVFVS